MKDTKEYTTPVFTDISSPKTIDTDISEEQQPTEVESVCFSCGDNGVTRLLLVKVPHFRELIVMSFTCEKCGYRDQEVQFGGVYNEHGAILDLSDLDRQIVKSDYAVVSIPEVGFEIPAKTQKGTINTIEGILERAIDGISEQQALRKIMQPEVYEKLQTVIQQLQKFKDFQFSDEELSQKKGVAFHFVVDDPSGNSNIENPKAPAEDPQINVSFYTRTKEQNKALGLGLTAEDDNSEEIAAGKIEQEEQRYEEMAQKSVNLQQQKSNRSAGIVTSEEDVERFKQSLNDSTAHEVVSFPEVCYSCGKQGELKMVLCDVPHFKEVVIMGFYCDGCGFKSNEIKAGGAIAPKGVRLTLRVEDEEDLKRDLLKSETAAVHIPEIGLEITHGSMGGRFTTVEGLLRTLKEQFQFTNQFHVGDSSFNIQKQKFGDFLDRLEDLASGKEKFTLIVEDPVSNSYIQNLYAPDPDPQLTSEEFERSWEENEDLGLHDMNVDNY